MREACCDYRDHSGECLCPEHPESRIHPLGRASEEDPGFEWEVRHFDRFLGREVVDFRLTDEWQVSEAISHVRAVSNQYRYHYTINVYRREVGAFEIVDVYEPEASKP